ncbi:MAG: hypothetical protein CLLPBCKN_005885 [Chroococcidiopsis cubana SAG 39.79]|nr:hypothetical protein [Chroococcidiopsis cubana SAG 39.79]
MHTSSLSYDISSESQYIYRWVKVLSLYDWISGCELNTVATPLVARIIALYQLV